MHCLRALVTTFATLRAVWSCFEVPLGALRLGGWQILGVGYDVVARQLREAAEAETGPLLKEKLWEKNKKYKEARD